MDNPAAWLPVLTAIANIGFSAVVGWYLLTKAIPDMQRKFSEDMDKQRKDFGDALAQQRADFNATFEREKQGNQKLLDMVANQMLEIVRRSADKIDVILAEVKKK